MVFHKSKFAKLPVILLPSLKGFFERKKKCKWTTGRAGMSFLSPLRFWGLREERATD